MNWSLYSADRNTHVKIVAVALVAATVVAGIAIAARNLNLGTEIMTAQRAPLIKAGQPVIWTDRAGTAIR